MSIFSEDDARNILWMKLVCLSEDKGPRATQILLAIAEQYPKLVVEYSGVDWPHEDKEL